MANTQRGDTDGNATSVRSKAKRGRPRKSTEDDEDSQTTHFYLENADGTLVSATEIAEMSRKARTLWRTLDEEDLAPQTFGQISTKSWEYFSRLMLVDKAHDFLLLCDDGEWKLKEWCTRSYPSWHRNRFNQDDKDADKDQDTGMSILSLPRLTDIGIHSFKQWINCV